MYQKQQRNRMIQQQKKQAQSSKKDLSANIIITFPTDISCYLGQKGYTIQKSDLSLEQLEKLKSMLLVKPMVNGAPVQDMCSSYPIYRESGQKIYVPRYFGEKQFGEPKQYRIPEGENISLEFNGTMREIQKKVIDKYMDKVGGVNGGGGLLELYCGFGKTICALKICSLLKKKTFIIVHKEFLLNQWVERIEQFLPGARIGKIQGQIVDVENKDIVIGMLQSLSMKEYPQSIFETFGLTIIDEVHHISSQVFSCALFKIVTKYMLGLSATMNRKDGTTDVFKMFLGDVVYKSVREDDFNVIVRGVFYITEDADFNEIVYDFRGQVQYSTMITKLCGFNRRSEFIINIVRDLLAETWNENQQIMILAHNKSLLTYLYDAIEHHQIATVGYYVGGMKEAALKISETKQVIIATYSMAAEALDIKTLTTLIMATPKTDIEQAVGRILREKTGNKMVIDIIDAHTPFKNQWNKRRAFYRKQNYKIVLSNGNLTKIDKSLLKKEIKSDDEEENEELDIPLKKCLIDINKMDFIE
jgi:superfamily II DNA or RNA helicase